MDSINNKEVRKRMEEEDDLRREYELWMRNQKFRENAAEARGKAEGEAIGAAKERAKAYEEKLEMARKMKSKQMPIEDISAITGLSIEEISGL